MSPDARYSLPSAAAHAGNKALFQYFLDKGVREDAQKLRTSLLAAAENGQTEMLRFLLDSRVDIDGKNKSGESALLLAFRSRALDAIELLLERGAQCGEDLLVLHAARSGSPKILDRVMSRREITPPFLLFAALKAAAHSTSLDIVKRLLELGAPADPTDIARLPTENPLLAINFTGENEPGVSHDAARIAELLISHGAPLHHTSFGGNDALMLAAASGNCRAVELLLSKGARIGQAEFASGANALQIAIMRLEAMLNGLESCSVEQVENMSLVVLALLNAMDVQENRRQLTKDAVNRTKHRVVQDMILGARSASNRRSPYPSSDLLLSLLDERNQPSRNLMDFLQKHKDLLLSTQANPSFDNTMRSRLMHHGFVHSVIDLLLPFLKALPAMAPALLGNHDKNADVDLTAFYCGMLLAVRLRTGPPEGILDPYAPFPIDMSVKAALHNAMEKIFGDLFAHADHMESIKLSACFSKLFETCLDISMQGMETALLITQIQPVPGRIAQALVKDFVYAKLAELIEAAWMSAWKTIANAQADEKYGADFQHSSSAGHMQTFLAIDEFPMIEATDLWTDFLGSGNQQWSNPAWDVNYPATSATSPRTFADTPACTDLLAQFRLELKRMINTPGTKILRLPGASAEQESIYSELMFPQLHMLAQFIEPEPKAQAAASSAASSSASSSSMPAAPSM